MMPSDKAFFLFSPCLVLHPSSAFFAFFIENCSIGLRNLNALGKETAISESVSENERFSSLCKGSKPFAHLTSSVNARCFLFYFIDLRRLMCRRTEWHLDCVEINHVNDTPEMIGRRFAMMEFRWVVFLVLWTLLIGPVLDFTQHTNSAQSPRAKQAQTSKTAR
jgi:hypothetical protein